MIERLKCWFRKKQRAIQEDERVYQQVGRKIDHRLNEFKSMLLIYIGFFVANFWVVGNLSAGIFYYNVGVDYFKLADINGGFIYSYERSLYFFVSIFITYFLFFSIYSFLYILNLSEKIKSFKFFCFICVAFYGFQKIIIAFIIIVIFDFFLLKSALSKVNFDDYTYGYIVEIEKGKNSCLVMLGKISGYYVFYSRENKAHLSSIGVNDNLKTCNNN